MNEISITGELGQEFGIVDFRDQLTPDTKLVRLASHGGHGTTGQAIADEIAATKLDVYADYAGSAAVPILAAGRHRQLAADGYIFLHRTWTVRAGNATELADIAAALAAEDLAYADWLAARCSCTSTELLKLMDDNTSLTPPEALAAGLIDEITPATGAAARPKPEATAAAEYLSQLESYQLRAAEGIKPIRAGPLESPRVQRIVASTAATSAPDNHAPVTACRSKNLSPAAWLELISAALRHARSRCRNTDKLPPIFTARWLDQAGVFHFEPPRGTENAKFN